MPPKKILEKKILFENIFFQHIFDPNTKKAGVRINIRCPGYGCEYAYCDGGYPLYLDLALEHVLGMLHSFFMNSRDYIITDQIKEQVAASMKTMKPAGVNQVFKTSFTKPLTEEEQKVQDERNEKMIKEMLATLQPDDVIDEEKQKILDDSDSDSEPTNGDDEMSNVKERMRILEQKLAELKENEKVPPEDRRRRARGKKVDEEDDDEDDDDDDDLFSMLEMTQKGKKKIANNDASPAKTVKKNAKANTDASPAALAASPKNEPVTEKKPKIANFNVVHLRRPSLLHQQNQQQQADANSLFFQQHNALEVLKQQNNDFNEQIKSTNRRTAAANTKEYNKMVSDLAAKQKELEQALALLRSTHRKIHDLNTAVAGRDFRDLPAAGSTFKTGKVICGYPIPVGEGEEPQFCQKLPPGFGNISQHHRLCCLNPGFLSSLHKARLPSLKKCEEELEQWIAKGSSAIEVRKIEARIAVAPSEISTSIALQLHANFGSHAAAAAALGNPSLATTLWRRAIAEPAVKTKVVRDESEEKKCLREEMLKRYPEYIKWYLTKYKQNAGLRRCFEQCRQDFMPLQLENLRPSYDEFVRIFYQVISIRVRKTRPELQVHHKFVRQAWCKMMLEVMELYDRKLKSGEITPEQHIKCRLNFSDEKLFHFLNLKRTCWVVNEPFLDEAKGMFDPKQNEIPFPRNPPKQMMLGGIEATATLPPIWVPVGQGVDQEMYRHMVFQWIRCPQNQKVPEDSTTQKKKDEPLENPESLFAGVPEAIRDEVFAKLPHHLESEPEKLAPQIAALKALLLDERLFNTTIFIQDNAPCHGTANNYEFFKTYGFFVCPWPPVSPDLNVIENGWTTMNGKYKRTPVPEVIMKPDINTSRGRKRKDLPAEEEMYRTTHDELKLLWMQEEIAEFLSTPEWEQTRRWLICSFQLRCRAIVEVNGEVVNDWGPFRREWGIVKKVGEVAEAAIKDEEFDRNIHTIDDMIINPLMTCQTKTLEERVVEMKTRNPCKRSSTDNTSLECSPPVQLKPSADELLRWHYNKRIADNTIDGATLDAAYEKLIAKGQYKKPEEEENDFGGGRGRGRGRGVSVAPAGQGRGGAGRRH